MAYNYYYPQQYYTGAQMPLNAPQMQSNAQQAQSNGITWVQGEAGAKAFPVLTGQSVLLMDSEESVFYIKSTDNSGMPQPLRIFEYTERTAQTQNAAGAKASTDYVTRSEFEELKKAVQNLGGEG